jgi:hypothetical protein
MSSSIRHQTLVSFCLRPLSVAILPNVPELLVHEFSHVLQYGDPCFQEHQVQCDRHTILVGCC